VRICSTFAIDPHRLVSVPDDLKAIILDPGPNVRSQADLFKVQTFFEREILPESRFQKWKERLGVRTPPANGREIVTGTLSGRFEMNGEIPQTPLLNIPEFKADKRGETYRNPDWRFSRFGLMDESLLVGPRHGLKNVFVWIRDKKRAVATVIRDEGIARARFNGVQKWTSGAACTRVLGDESRTSTRERSR
jgi:hypothetical protein